MTTPAATVVALSRQMGSGGSHVGQAIADARGLRYIDEAMLRDASHYLLTHDPSLREVPARMDTWWSTMAGALAMGGMGGLGVLPVETAQEAETARIERRIIEEVAGHHPSVLISEEASHALHGRPGVLTVYLHAPESWRIDRVAHRQGLTPDQARDAVRHSDRHRAALVRALTGADCTDVRQYDLAIDTAAIGLETAVDLVLRLVKPE